MNQSSECYGNYTEDQTILIAAVKKIIFVYTTQNIMTIFIKSGLT